MDDVGQSESSEFCCRHRVTATTTTSTAWAHQLIAQSAAVNNNDALPGIWMLDIFDSMPRKMKK